MGSTGNMVHQACFFFFTLPQKKYEGMLSHQQNRSDDYLQKELFLWEDSQYAVCPGSLIYLKWQDRDRLQCRRSRKVSF